MRLNAGRRVQFYNFWEEDLDSMYWSRWFEARPGLLARHPSWKVGMFSVFGERDMIRHTDCDINIFYSAENLKLKSFWRYADAFLSEPKIDLSIGFEYFDNERYCRFPNWMDVFFVTRQDIPRVCQRLRYPDVSEKRTFASLISSHDRGGLRAGIMDALEQVGKVSCPGKFRHNDDSLQAEYGDDKVKYLRQCHFNICPENSNAYGYVTEKLFQAIYSGCIPIYWGSYNRPEPDVLNPDAIIFWNQDPAGAVKQIDDLMSHPGLMKEFIAQPRLLPTAEEYISDCMGRIEKKLADLTR